MRQKSGKLGLAQDAEVGLGPDCPFTMRSKFAAIEGRVDTLTAKRKARS